MDAYSQGMADRWAQNPQYGAYNTPRSPMSNLFGQYAPDFTNFSTQMQLGQNQYDLLMGGYGADRGDLRDQYGLAMQGLGLDRGALGVDRGAANRGIRNTRQEERIARALLANSQQQLTADAGNAVTRTQSEATASGAFSAPGMRHDMAETYGNLVMGKERNQLGFQRDLLGIREQRNQHRDALQNLDIQSQRLGLQSDELQQQLRTGLRGLRLDTAMSTNDILAGLSSTNAQRAALSRQIFQMAIQMGMT